jgi:hypothetical protein
MLNGIFSGNASAKEIIKKTHKLILKYRKGILQQEN